MNQLHRTVQQITFLALTCGWASLSTSAAEIELSNGDRISGEISAENSETITLISPILGKITLSREHAKLIPNRPASEPPEEPLAERPSDPEPKSKPKKTEKLPDEVPNIDSLEGTQRWSGKLELGFRHQSGRRDSTNFDLRASAKRQLKRDLFDANARLLFSEQDDKTTSDRYDGSFQWRRELNDRTFAQTLTSFTRDDLKSINQNWEQNVGAGVRVLKNENYVLNVGGGLTGQYRDSLNTESGFSTLLELFQDYKYRINGRITLLQNAVAQYTPNNQTRFITVANQPTAVEGATNYKVRFNTTLQGKLSQQLSMNLRFEYEFDNAVADKNARSDQRITSSIGYGF
jgi:putative salt-induced outer membrane protein YdiY